MRGKPLLVAHVPRCVGITPAHAGKTGIKAAFNLDFGDHPRACGENAALKAPVVLCLGSPPRMRGKHFGKGVFPWLILVLSLDPL